MRPTRFLLLSFSPAALATLLHACSNSGQGVTPTAPPGPCNPLDPLPVAAGTVLAVGEDPRSTVYLADQQQTSSTLGRVFVSSGDVLYRQHVVSAVQQGSGASADYSFAFEEPGSADAGALVVQIRGGAVTGVALGPGSPTNFIGASDAGLRPLAVVDASSTLALAEQNLPSLPLFVADLDGGQAIVVVGNTDDDSPNDFRVFYGSPRQMVEYPVVSVLPGAGGQWDLTFSVDSGTYALSGMIRAPASTGETGAPGAAPASLLGAAGRTLAVTPRSPTPTGLGGFTFQCLGP